jgi:hypothetical protein
VIDCLVFSRDRPLQLDGLLSSLERYAAHLFKSVTVLHTSSSPIFQLGYLDCARNHEAITFWRQFDSFEQDVHEWLHVADEYVCFLVDDDLFIRQAPELERALPRWDEVCFSLRLWHAARSWMWPQARDDYAYPLALDGHIYRREAIAALLRFSFDDPTRLEAGLAGRADSLGVHTYGYMAADIVQCLVGIPANRVSLSSGMPFIGGPEHDPQTLLERYLAGWRLDPDAMPLADVDTAHADIPLALKRVAVTVPE